MSGRDALRRTGRAIAEGSRIVGRGLQHLGGVIDRGKSRIEPELDKALAVTAVNTAGLYGLTQVIERTDFSNATNGLIMFGAGATAVLGNYGLFLSERTQPLRDGLARLSRRLDRSRPASWLRTGILMAAILTSAQGVKPYAKDIAHDVQSAFLEMTAPSTARTRGLSDIPIPSGVPTNLKARPDWYDAVGFEQTTNHDFTGTKLAKKNGIIGRVQRTLRWQPLYRAVEQKYGMPEGTLAGMMMQESYGDPVQPNATNDGGLGLAHIQGNVAKSYGLHIFGDSSTATDHKHGRSIKEMLKKCNFDPACAQEYDERAHALKLLDTAARIVAEGKKKHGTWEHGIQHYRMPGRVSGRTAIRYRKSVERWRANILSNRIIAQAAADFDRRNTESFRSYLERFHETNNDWGLRGFKRL